MKVVFISNFASEHQLPFCLEMIKQLGDGFRFIATEHMDSTRLNMGFEDVNDKYNFIVQTYLNEESVRKAKELIDDADIVISGSVRDEWIKKRLDENKIVFRYRERVFKDGIRQTLRLRTIKKMLTKHTIYRRRNVFMLCASAYAAGDMKLFAAYPGKKYKWGYFPALSDLSKDELFGQKDHPVPKLIWTGRLIACKHPEAVVCTAERLKKEGYPFKLEIIGDGEMREYLENSVREKGLDDTVTFTGSISPQSVREHMEKANISVCTSDFHEGWGAVVNEAMSSGCACVSSHAVGAAGFLINNGDNGFIYENGNNDELYEKVRTLVADRELTRRVGLSAYDTMLTSWGPEAAVRNMLYVFRALMDGQKVFCDSGPCSRAYEISQRAMYGNLTKVQTK